MVRCSNACAGCYRQPVSSPTRQVCGHTKPTGLRRYAKCLGWWCCRKPKRKWRRLCVAAQSTACQSYRAVQARAFLVVPDPINREWYWAYRRCRPYWKSIPKIASPRCNRGCVIWRLRRLPKHMVCITHQIRLHKSPAALAATWRRMPVACTA